VNPRRGRSHLQLLGRWESRRRPTWRLLMTKSQVGMRDSEPKLRPCTGSCGVDRVPPDWGTSLNESDYAMLEKASWLTREIVDQAMLRRVDEYEGREVVGQKGRIDCAGILFPYYWPGEPHISNYRLRRDNPDWKVGKDGKPKPDKKYLGPAEKRQSALYSARGHARTASRHNDPNSHRRRRKKSAGTLEVSSLRSRTASIHSCGDRGCLELARQSWEIQWPPW
jgi:hypothetical protein